MSPPHGRPKEGSHRRAQPEGSTAIGTDALLSIEHLTVRFGAATVVKDVSFAIAPGEKFALVGESGSGKSITALSILRLVDAATSSGAIRFEGIDLMQQTEAQMQALRGARIGMIFQEPMTALNPLYTVGNQIIEVLQLHEAMAPAAARARAIELLARTGIPEPERRIDVYPHQLSGGQRQRAMIAMALACKPRLLIADEPTTALDVTIQAQILDLLNELKDRLGMAILLITHAMGVVAETCQRVVVMYAGKVVEEAPVAELFANPRHPYTQGLIRWIPRIDLDASQKVRLEAIAGTVPKLIAPPEGCRFAPRCKFAMAACTAATPELREVSPGHKVACIL